MRVNKLHICLRHVLFWVVVSPETLKKERERERKETEAKSHENIAGLKWRTKIFFLHSFKLSFSPLVPSWSMIRPHLHSQKAAGATEKLWSRRSPA